METTTAITTTITSFTIGYNSSSDNKNQYKITVLRKSQVLVLTHEGMPELNGVYIPEHKMPWNGALKQFFNDLVEYIDNDDKDSKILLTNGKFVQREKYLRVNFYNNDNRNPSRSSSRRINVNFYPWSDPSDQTYVSFAKISDFYVDHGVRSAQSRIRNNPRRLALAMSLHPRIGKDSLLLGMVGEDLLRSIVVILTFGAEVV